MGDTAATKVCPICGSVSQISAKFCTKCGYAFSQASLKPQPNVATPKPETVCPKCGTIRPAGAKFCVTCGYQFKQPLPAANQQGTPTTNSNVQGATQAPPQPIMSKAEDMKDIKRLFILIGAIIAIFIVVVVGTNAQDNEGLHTADEVMHYINGSEKAKSEMTRLATDDLDDDDPENIFVVKNKKTGNYVFEYEGRKVYLVQIVTKFYDDTYRYVNLAVGIDKDNGNYYVVEPSDSYDDRDAEVAGKYVI
ncbi:hypothetical protein FC83_GL002608 [Agrilactobacillus composti DSM 18527 = JCM 14202]|uniref:DZANK-type domain-containing protein n=1 Tax=Agrilactobacillus composti DSM 18527 = JCM 14202 TaxID=1423734 RepID=X0PVR4_9LACO|nr:zinc ribbon domain-containing protein [Agrilactobacillus composti]KRM36733.1 hypothetical protein FC83_GL002608 [Agrilactobacillus composti DSM 18527 = JCM 14202]GAF41586.1 hypothetical protein JCM14202_3536 [Agrilactobacillus composti DSM 18527 = JCM 14202]